MKKIDTIFSQNPLDRLDQVRGNRAEYLRRKTLENSVFLLFHNNQIILHSDNQCLFDHALIQKYNINIDEAVLLGAYEQQNYFSLAINDIDDLENGLVGVATRDYSSGSHFPENMLGIIAQGCSVLNWHLSHTHCANCGHATHIAHSGWRRDCPNCQCQHFPRVDPVVIMLVTYNEQCLLGRGHGFSENRYSCLAGYVESGETVEDAARRELFEEAGVIGGDVRYLLSQPWPFPSTLMMGMHVEAKGQKLNIDYHEIADAIWVEKADVIKALNGDDSLGFSLPPSIAIARNLLEIWVSDSV